MGDSTETKTHPAVAQARDVLRIEAEGILALMDRVGDDFIRAVEMIYACHGRVVVTGLGKSGLVGRKISATLNSTGTPSVFLHPVEARHGDLGMVLPGDVVLALSNSGETTELKAVIPNIRSLGARLVAMTGVLTSTLAKSADVVLDAGVEREACPLGLAPTTSTTVALALGDALAVALIHKRSFGSRDFARLHPAGSLGERLSVPVRKVMVSGDGIPRVRPDTPVAVALAVMNEKKLGAVFVVDDEGRLAGIFTDGDLRRLIVGTPDFTGRPMSEAMTAAPARIGPDRRASEAVELMQSRVITVLPVVGDDDRLLGAIHLQQLLGQGTFRFHDPAEEAER